MSRLPVGIPSIPHLIRLVKWVYHQGMTAKTIAIKASRYRRLQDETEQARANLAAEIAKDCANGMSEYDAADAAGVTRMTVRKWLGKG